MLRNLCLQRFLKLSHPTPKSGQRPTRERVRLEILFIYKQKMLRDVYQEDKNQKKENKMNRTSDLPDSNQRPKDLSANTTVLHSTN